MTRDPLTAALAGYVRGTEERASNDVLSLRRAGGVSRDEHPHAWLRRSHAAVMSHMRERETLP